MNLVRAIVDQLSGETLGRLSTLIGTDNETTETAAHAAVPSILAGLAGLASRQDGAKKLTSTLGGLDLGSLGNFAQLLGGDTGALMQRGSGLLSSLFGDSLINSLTGAISNYSGLNPGTAKSLLAYLLPMVLGKVGSQWKSMGGTPNALTTLFTDQKRNIADAIPAGFDLDEIAGLGDLAQSARSAGRTAEAAAPSVASWAIPLAALLVGAFLLWQFLNRGREANPPAAVNTTANEANRTTAMKPVVPEMPALPDAAKVNENLAGIFTSLNDTLTGIKDAAGAQAAMPQLESLNTKIDGIRGLWAKLPESARTTMQKFVDDKFAAFKLHADAANLIPGISAQFKALIADIVRKLQELSSAHQATN